MLRNHIMAVTTKVELDYLNGIWVIFYYQYCTHHTLHL